MAGIYVHIPFCRQACTYCDFHFSTNLSRKGELAEAIAYEAALQQHFFKNVPALDTLYFGGGTPSLLSAEELDTILSPLRKHFPFSEGFEFTLECNPDDLDRDSLRVLADAGVNRLSIGVQSFREEDLKLMNRSHNAAQARDSIVLAREMGFDNISVDLIYGIPGLGREDWLANVRMLVDLGVPHVSAYALTVEEKTALDKQVEAGEVKMPEDGAFESQYLALVAGLEAAGYEHYELSNFAKPGRQSRHNSSYWKGEPYLGLGPSAHSHQLGLRSWNVSNNARYLKMLGEGSLPIAESELLTEADEANEYLLTRLRMRRGIELQKFQDLFGWDLFETNIPQIDLLVKMKKMELVDGWLRLTPEGMLLSNAIIAEFFID